MIATKSRKTGGSTDYADFAAQQCRKQTPTRITTPSVMKSVPSRGSVGSIPMPKAMLGKPQAIRYPAAILIPHYMRTIDPALPRIADLILDLSI